MYQMMFRRFFVVVTPIVSKFVPFHLTSLWIVKVFTNCIGLSPLIKLDHSILPYHKTKTNKQGSYDSFLIRKLNPPFFYSLFYNRQGFQSSSTTFCLIYTKDLNLYLYLSSRPSYRIDFFVLDCCSLEFQS